MKKHIFLFLLFIIFSETAIFANDEFVNDEFENDEFVNIALHNEELTKEDLLKEELAKEENSYFLKNTIVIDVMPFLSGLIMGIAFIDYKSSISTGFGIHYERNILEKFSLSGRFQYTILNVLDYDDYFMNMSAISIESHGRYYPFKKLLFLDGMSGYALLLFETSGEDKVMAHYFKLGAKIGCRIDFGKQGGFVFEPGFAYSYAFGPDKEFFKNDFFGIFNFLYNIIARSMVSGASFSLGLGYRF